MFTVTTAALDRLSRKLARRKPSKGATLRLTRTSAGWELRLGRVRLTDRQFLHEGQCVLVLDGAASLAMRQMTLDVNGTDSGPRLKLLRATGSKE